MNKINLKFWLAKNAALIEKLKYTMTDWDEFISKNSPIDGGMYEDDMLVHVIKLFISRMFFIYRMNKE